MKVENVKKTLSKGMVLLCLYLLVMMNGLAQQGETVKTSNNRLLESFTLPKSLKICGGESVTWTEDVTYADEIRVCTGSTLTIESEVGFVEDGKLIVERGGKLILDGGIVTAQDTMLWKGIELWGTASATQNPIDQGWVQVINSGTIENALVGIKTCKIDIDPIDGDVINYNYTGGIVQANDAMLRNNRFAVIFYDYSYSSVSKFDNCDFVLNDDYIGEYDPGYFVRMNSMHGIDYNYCRFKNESSNNCYGKGIYGFNSGFRVEGKYLNGNPFNGEFLNLKRGIYATSSGTSYFPEITHTDFTGNHRGVYFSAMQLGSVKNCTIETGPTCAGASYGIYLDNSTGYEIEGNHISPEDYDGIGIVVNNSGGEPNIVYNNVLSGLTYGIMAQKENRSPDGTGLVLKCNEYIDNKYDELVLWKEPMISPYAGIAEDQGADENAPDAPAGNRFSWRGPTGTPTDIYNEANDIIYYYHYLQNDPWHLRPDYYTDQTVSPFPNTHPDAYWDPDESCPPSDGGGGTGGDSEGMKSAMAASGFKADSVQNIINILKDGGSTQEMKTEVELSTPPETYTVYNELMNNSPYISDTVMEVAIEKEDVLPNVMIRDVMVANPHNAKDEQLMDKIEERNNPMPDYMKAQILQGGSLVSVYEKLQSKLAYYKQKRYIAFKSLVKYYIADTVDPGASIDSLLVLLQNENSIHAKYRLAMLNGEQGQWSECLNVLNNVPGQFELTEDQTEIHTQLTNFYTLLTEMAQEGKTFAEADSLMIEELLAMEANQTGRPSAYARNILLAIDEISYEEPVLMPDFLKSSAAKEECMELMQALEEHYYLKVFPNPAGDYIVLEHKLETEPANAYVEIYNAKGEVVKNHSLTGLQNQQSVDIKNLLPGVYIATIYENGKELESVKFTKVK